MKPKKRKQKLLNRQADYDKNMITKMRFPGEYTRPGSNKK